MRCLIASEQNKDLNKESQIIVVLRYHFQNKEMNHCYCGIIYIRWILIFVGFVGTAEPWIKMSNK